MRAYKIISMALIFVGFAVLSSYAEEAWKKEFDDICSKTDNAMSLTEGELKSLVERCDKLKPQIEALDDANRRFYTKRLKMCKDLFVFMLETKENEKQKEKEKK